MIGAITAGLFSVGVAPVTNSYESIATTTVSTPVSSVTFSSIPSTYKHLQIRAITRGSASATDGWNANFNSDTGSNYYILHVLYGNGSSAGAYAGGTFTEVQLGDIVGSSTTANSFSASVTDILDYQDTNKNKTVRTIYGFDLNGSGTAALASGLWMNTSAINSINLTVNSGNFAQYSQFALYGIKG